jgi:hypothetical protein
MTEEQKESLGILIDEIDNLAHGLQLPMPDNMHVECMRSILPDKIKRFKELFIEITNENPWE